jgi:hypothetical protein
MFGDILGGSSCQIVSVRSGVSTTARVPILTGGSFKISENESPRPVDRVFFNYNYFNNVNLGESNSVPGQTGAGSLSQVDVHRETIGFEKTFLDGNASIGMRLPFTELAGDGDLAHSQIDDLTIITKFAFLNDTETGDVLSGGLVVTAPTGQGFTACNITTVPIPGGGTTTVVTQDNIHPTLFQPYLGYIVNFDSLFVIGFSSVVIPTDDRDVTFMSNDIGLGYQLYRARGGDEWITSIAPTLEAHINTPFNHRGLNDGPVSMPDLVDIVSGARFQFSSGLDVGTAIGIPVTGPKLYDFEALVQVNLRF